MTEELRKYMLVLWRLQTDWLTDPFKNPQLSRVTVFRAYHKSSRGWRFVAGHPTSHQSSASRIWSTSQAFGLLGLFV